MVLSGFQPYLEGGSPRKCPHTFCTGITGTLRDFRKEETQAGGWGGVGGGVQEAFRKGSSMKLVVNNFLPVIMTIY